MSQTTTITTRNAPSPRQAKPQTRVRAQPKRALDNSGNKGFQLKAKLRGHHPHAGT